MKSILFYILLLVSGMSHAQTFNELLNASLNSAYRYTIEHSDGKMVYYNIHSMPYKFRTAAHWEKRKIDRKKLNIYLAGNYDAFLGKDTIVVYSYTQWILHNFNEKRFRHNFSRLKWNVFVSSASIGDIYIYINDKVWIKENVRELVARWTMEVARKERQQLKNLVNISLTNFLCEVQEETNGSNMLVVDNTFGINFFLYLYSDKYFPYMVASQEDLTKRVLRKYNTLVGWCSIGLDGNTFSIQLRAVDSAKYMGLKNRDNVDDAVFFSKTYYFRYCDIHKKWCLVEHD